MHLTLTSSDAGRRLEHQGRLGLNVRPVLEDAYEAQPVGRPKRPSDGLAAVRPRKHRLVGAWRVSLAD